MDTKDGSPGCTPALRAVQELAEKCGMTLITTGEKEHCNKILEGMKRAREIINQYTRISGSPEEALKELKAFNKLATGKEDNRLSELMEELAEIYKQKRRET